MKDYGPAIDKYMLRVAGLIALLISVGVMVKTGGPIALGLKFGIFTLLTAFGAYLTAFFGIMAYMVARTRLVDEILGSANALGRFSEALLEPMRWAHISLLFTLGYYVIASYYPEVSGAASAFAIASTSTTAFAIFRNFHLLRMFLGTTLRAIVAQYVVKETLMNQIGQRIAEAVKNGDISFEKGCGDPTCPDCHPPDPPTTVQ